MIRTLIISIALCGAVGCSKSDSKEETKPTAQAAKPDNAAPAAEDDEAKRQREQAERMVKARQDDVDAAKTEAERWNDELRAKVKELAEGTYADAKAHLEAIVQSPHRVPGHADRDAHRHPVETLVFFGIRPDMTVIETGAGRGWYTEILAPLLAASGKLVVLSRDPNGPADSYGTIAALRVKDVLAKSDELYGKVDAVIVDPPSKLELGPAGSADMVLAFREMHGWHRGNSVPQWLAAIHAVLKPGGVFGVVQHRAKPDAKVEDSGSTGYLPEEWVIQQVEAAGFKLEARSEINANPKDTKDYEGGVWTLPPNVRDGDKDRAKYEAIGESDRMTLKFVKVAE